ncbi:hypothetical protein Tco_0560937 [Tanacetum coccineum]
MEGCDQLFQLSTLGYKCFLYLAKVLNVTDSPFEQVYYFKAKAWTSVPSSVYAYFKAISTQESMFSLKVNYAGFFTESLGRSYVNGFSGKTIMYCSFLKPDMSLDNGLYALGNDKDVRRMVEYIRLCYKMIEVFIEHDKTTVYTYIDAAYNTQTKKCVIMEILNGVSPKNAPISKMKPRRPPNTTTLTTPTKFANDFYSASNPFLEEDNPFFGLDSEPVDATTAKNECVDKGKGVVLDDDQVHVATDNTMENETDDENNDGDSSKSSEHDELVDVDNDLVDVAVDMDHFDRTNAKTMGNEGTPEFNADEEFDMGMDVIDTEEFESASDEDRIDRIRSRKIKQLNKQSQLKEGGLHKVHFLLDKNSQTMLK